MRLSPEILFASTNRGKLAELQALVPEPYRVLSIAEFVRNPHALAYVEKHSTYLENSIAKARLANHAAHYPCLADDSGLEALALDGKPGPRSARYATVKPGQFGVSQDQANIEKLLDELKGKPREARFVCALALVMEGLCLTAIGTLEGRIAESPRGTNGFGYDPVFIPKASAGIQRTLAEMSDEEKNQISHRAIAVRALFEKIRSSGLILSKP